MSDQTRTKDDDAGGRRTLRVRPATLRDAEELAPRLRDADLREIQAVTGEPPLAAVVRCIQSSDPACAIVSPTGDTIAVFGVVPDGEARGVVWLVGAEEIASNAVSFLRLSREWIPRLHDRYRVLWNFVDVRNEVHVHWLRWCGFTIHRTVEHGVERRLFLEFSSSISPDAPARAAFRLGRRRPLPMPR